MKIYINSQKRGFRQTLKLAEESVTKVQLQDLKFLDWETAIEVNEQFYDFLMTFTADEALRVIEPFANEGFEAWRQLKLRYILSGGRTEVDRTMRLFCSKACRNMTELPAAIDLLDKELKHDEETSGHRQPDHTKIALLVQLFPEADQKELKHRYVRNQK